MLPVNERNPEYNCFTRDDLLAQMPLDKNYYTQVEFSSEDKDAIAKFIQKEPYGNKKIFKPVVAAAAVAAPVAAGIASTKEGRRYLPDDFLQPPPVEHVSRWDYQFELADQPQPTFIDYIWNFFDSLWNWDTQSP